MNYEKIYQSFISSRKCLNRNKKDTYYEKHHILPKSLGGTNDKTNLVLLTAKEHFFAHLLLVQFTVGNDKNKMVYALWRMCHPKKYVGKIYSSRQYEHIKSLKVKIPVSNEVKLKLRNLNLGKKLSDTTKKKISEAGLINRPVGSFKHSIDTKLKLSELRKGVVSPMFGKNHSDETKLKISKSKIGTKQSKETIEKRFKNRIGKKRNILKCPHCNKEGGEGNMQRWHFDNCKNKVV